MTISASLVKELREKTGAGMMDCKKALEESNGDFEKAIEFLRKKGAAVAAKRAEKSTNEGVILTKLFDNNKSAVMLEVNCETDFVANSADFLEFSNFVLNVIAEKKPSNVASLMKLEAQGKKVEEELNALIGKIGEKIQVTRFTIESTGTGQVIDYVHHGSKLGVLVRIDNIPNGKNDELQPVMKDIAMQVAAMKPAYVYREEVPKEVIEKEIEIYKEVSRKEGKPEQVVEKIAQGKLNKFFEENCLYEQAFIKDNTKTVGQLIKEFNKNHSSAIKLVLFKRFHIGDEHK